MFPAEVIGKLLDLQETFPARAHVMSVHVVDGPGWIKPIPNSESLLDMQLVFIKASAVLEAARSLESSASGDELSLVRDYVANLEDVIQKVRR